MAHPPIKLQAAMKAAIQTVTREPGIMRKPLQYEIQDAVFCSPDVATRAVKMLTDQEVIVCESKTEGYQLGPNTTPDYSEYRRHYTKAQDAPSLNLPKFSCPIAQFVYQQGAV